MRLGSPRWVQAAFLTLALGKLTTRASHHNDAQRHPDDTPTAVHCNSTRRGAEIVLVSSLMAAPAQTPCVGSPGARSSAVSIVLLSADL
jgi:hypothetical protein